MDGSRQDELQWGGKRRAFYINFVAVATTNGQWVRHGMAWDGMAEEIKASLPFIFPPCRHTGDATYDRDRSLSFLFGHLLTLVAVNLWLMAISKAPKYLLGLLLKGHVDHNVT